MGNKIDAKKIMDDNNVPTVPGLNNIENKVQIKSLLIMLAFQLLLRLQVEVVEKV